MTLNDILQATGVALVLLLAVIWIIRKIRRKDGDCGCGCEDCPVKKKCCKINND